MKKLLLVASFIAIACTATAQRQIVVEKTGNDNYVISFEELKQITFSGNTVNIEQTDGTKSSTTMGDISRIYFGDISSIADIGQQGGKFVEYISSDEIAISSNAGTTVTIYSVTGTQVLTKRISAQGTRISIASLPQGIYIVKANDRTAKIIKR